jgi:hypothetical protein
MVVHACNPSTQETEAEGLEMQGQPRLHSETLSQKKKKLTKTKCWGVAQW